ncbi:MAG: hypothetical protein RJA51_752 [Actinomycetota bacterium]
MDRTDRAATGRPADRILERAIEVIEAGGEVAIRTNVIAEECGVTAPILYRAFGNREGLVVAAQAERYRRASEVAVAYLVERVTSAGSRAELRDNIIEALDFITSPERSRNRRMRAEVIGSAVSRPALAGHVREIDMMHSATVAAAYAPAVANGWIAADLNLEAVVLWVQGIINGRTQIEFGAAGTVAAEWDRLTKTAVLAALFGD